MVYTVVSLKSDVSPSCYFGAAQHKSSAWKSPSSSNSNRGLLWKSSFRYCWVFICGAADRSGRGKRCCCSSSCCFGDHFSFSHIQFLGCVKEYPCLKRGVKGENLVLNWCKKAKTVHITAHLICQKYYTPRRRSVKGSLSCFFWQGHALLSQLLC